MLLFSLLVRCTSPLQKPGKESAKDDGKRVRRRFPFSPKRCRGSSTEPQPVLGTWPHLCLTRSETESCRNTWRRRETCTAPAECDNQKERPAPKKKKRAGRWNYESVVTAVRSSPATVDATTAATMVATTGSAAVAARSRRTRIMRCRITSRRR